jgi:ABC-type tungstate transport system substrate-binding protein
VIGTAATLGGLVLHLGADYQNFLLLIGSIFVPLSAVFVIDFFVLGRGDRWDVSTSAPTRLLMVIPWAIGFITYQLINPGSLGWWSRLWTRHVDVWLHFTPASWMSASLISFAIAAAVTVPLGVIGGQHRFRRSRV